MTLALYGKSRRRQSSLLLLGLIAVMVALIGGLAAREDARAQSFTLASADGDWSAPSGSPTCGYTLSDSDRELRWGCGISGGPQSGYRWDGRSSAITFNDGATIYLGRFTHFNNPISLPSITGANLDIDLVFSAPLPGASPNVTLSFAHEETSNSGDYEDCSYQIPGDTFSCPDRVVPTVPIGTSFNIGGADYTLTLVAFERDADGTCPATPASETVTPSFTTAEQQTNYGCLYGKIILAKPDLTVAKTSREVNSQAEDNSVEAGTQFRWEFVVNNIGSTSAQWGTGDVVFRDNLPAGATYALGTQPSGYTCTLSSPTGPSTFECKRTGGATTQAPNATLTFNVLATPTAAGTLANPVVTGICKVDPDGTEDEHNENNNTCSDTVTVTAPQVPDVAAHKQARKNNQDIDSVNMADPVFQWVITLTNNGNQNATWGENVDVFQDDLPAGATYSSITENSSNVGCSFTNSNTTIDCDVDNNESFTLLANGGNSLVITVTVTPNGSVPSLVNPRTPGLCRVDPDNTLTAEVNKANNDCSDTVTVNAAATIIVHKEEAGPLANVASTQQWDFSLSGGTPKSNIQINDAGQDSFTLLAPGTYTVKELNSGSVATCGSVDGSYRTFYGLATNPATLGQTMAGITVGAGETKHVYFKNESCPGTVAISKSSTPDTEVAAGGQATWTINVVIDVNPTTASATISDTLPEGWTIGPSAVSDNSSNVTCTGPVGATSFSCTLQNNSSVGTKTITVPVIAPANFPETNCKEYTNTVTLTGAGLSAPISAEDKLTVKGCINPTLTLTKTSTGVPSPLASGGTFNWVLTAVVSNGPTVANATITDTLPSGFTVNGAITDAADNGQASKMTCTPSGAVPGAAGFSCTLVSTAGNGTYTVTIPVKAPTVTSNGQCHSYTNTATASFAQVNGGPGGTIVQTNNSNSVTVTCPDVSITKEVNAPSTVDVGNPVSFTIKVTNSGPGKAYNVKVFDTLSSKANWSIQPAVAGCTAGASPLCTFAEMSPGTTTITLVGTTSNPASCGTIPNQASVEAAADSNSGNNTSLQVSATVNCPDPTVSKSSPATVNAGDPLAYTITVTPGGTGAQSVVLKDTPPAGVTWAVAGDDSGCVPNTTVTNPTQLSCTFNFAAGNSPAQSITLTATTTTAQCGPAGVKNTATIEPAQGSTDVNLTNNTDDATTVVQCPSVTLDKSAANTTINAGEQLKFTITVANGGPGTAKGFSLTDNLPAQGNDWSIQSQTGPAITCAISGTPGVNEVLHCPSSGTTDLAPTGQAPLVITLVSATDKRSCGLVENTASVTVTNNPTTVQPDKAETTVNCPDIEVTKEASGSQNPGTLTAGDTAEYTIVVKNVGQGKATNVTVTDNPLPGNLAWGNLSVVPATAPGCSISATGIVATPWKLDCTFAELAKDATVTIKVSAVTNKDVCGTLRNSVTVGATNEPTSKVDGKNTDDASIAVNCADISILKTPDQAEVNATDSIGFTITATNNGDGEARGVQMTDTLPSTTGLNWQIDAANSDATCSINGTLLKCDWPNLAKGQSKKVHITSVTTKDTCGTIDNTGNVSTTNDGTASSSTKIKVNCPNVSILKTVPQGQANPVNAGEDISFQIKVTVGGSGVAYNVMLNDLLPQNTSGWSVTNDPAKPAACGQPVGLNFTCNFGNVAAGTSYTITLSGKAIGAAGGVTCGPLTNAARVSAGNESDRTDNESKASIGVQCPDVVVAKVATKDTINAGETASWKITATNNGAGTALDVVVTDFLPAGLTWTPNNANCSVDQGAVPSPKLTCTLGSLAPSASVDILVTAPTTAAQCATLNNKAVIAASNEADEQESNNESKLVTITINCPDISVSKTAAKSPISAGDEASFTVTVKNNGQGVAKGVVLTDQLPAGTWSNDKGCAIDGSNVMTCEIGEMAPGTSFVVVLKATTNPAMCGPLPNQASATSTNEGTDEVTQKDNKSQLVEIDVNCPDVTVSKTPDGGTVSAGDNVVFSIVVSNNGEGTAYNVSLNDDLPAGFTWTSTESPDSEPDACIIASGKLDCDWKSLVAGGKVTVTLTAPTTAAECKAVPNTAVVGATNEALSGPASANNSDDGDVTVLCPDLEITKVADESPVDYGAGMSFTIKVTNIGQGVAKKVVVTEDLPDGIAWASDSAGCGIENFTIVCKFEEILPGEANAKTIVVKSATVPATCEPVVNNVSVAAANEPKETVGKNSASAQIEVRCGTIQVFKTDLTADAAPAGGWHFAIDKDESPFADRTIPAGGGDFKIEKVPFGTYSVAEAEAIFGECPRPNETSTYRTTVTGADQTIGPGNYIATWTFRNVGCAVVANAGNLEIHKVEDLNGNHVQDPGEVKLSGWPMKVTGGEFGVAGITPLTEDSGEAFGAVILPGIQSGQYTITEGSRTGYTTVGVVVNDGGTTFLTGNQATVNVSFEETVVVTFYNQPFGSIAVKKTAVTSHNGGPDQAAPNDDDGWQITVSSATCKVQQQKATNASGDAVFTGLPICDDYVVSENPVNAGSPGFVPASPASVSNVKPGVTEATAVTFLNRRSTEDPPCQDCFQQPTPTPTPTRTPVPTATNTPTNTPTASPTPVSTTAGEKTPGPGGPTPIAPSTGQGVFGGAVGGSNLLLVLVGLAAIASGLFFIGGARRRR